MSQDPHQERFSIDLQFKDDSGQWYRIHTYDDEHDGRLCMTFERTFGIKRPPETLEDVYVVTLYAGVQFAIGWLYSVTGDMVPQLLGLKP